MDIDAAKRITRLSAREFPGAKYDFLTCQLGVYEMVPVKTSAYRTVHERVFKLRFFGHDWDEAVASWQAATKEAK